MDATAAVVVGIILGAVLVLVCGAVLGSPSLFVQVCGLLACLLALGIARYAWLEGNGIAWTAGYLAVAVLAMVAMAANGFRKRSGE